ncbi:vWA domain-containing protein [Algirhabdus cladophorae]|uniref:vWA domain-containing protein n=1 Tax=Algirhabdus cladophorae TaxID=3377108 RepID=UPI003B84B3E1
MRLPELHLPDDPKLAYNITHFARALRVAGLPIGSGRILDALKAIEAAGFSQKQDFYWVLHGCFVSKPAHKIIFAQVFRLYWRDPQYLEHMMAHLSPLVRGAQEDRTAQAAEKRAAEALLQGVDRDMPPAPDEAEDTEVEIDASRTVSGAERLRHLDFEQMSVTEMAQAKRMIATLRLPVQPLVSRRFERTNGKGQIDGAQTLRAAMRRGGQIEDLARKAPRNRWPNLVCLCDISGSMSQYSRAVLHFLHAVSNAKGAGWSKVHGFTFGTRLTNITRHLATRDVDVALAAAGGEAQDWEGGTRIGACLHQFNRDWSRRVLGQGAVVLLITDGLDRDDPADLKREMQRLRLSAKRVIWLNPLLRWEKFAPKAGGIAAMMPYVDTFRAGHNIAALEGLAQALGKSEDGGEKDRMLAMMRDAG